MAHISEYLKPSELKSLTEKSDKKGALLVINNWALIFLAFYLVAAFPNLLTILFAIFLIGGRQLGLGILMHEAGHRTLFASDDLNHVIGQYLCAYPILGNLHAYAEAHQQHHRHAGSDKDPDLPNYDSYPVSRESFKRKIFRDLTGQTGVKLLTSLFRGGDRMLFTDQTRKHLIGGLIVNLILAIIVIQIFSFAVYLLWWAAYLTTYTMFARLRQIAEHGAVVNLYDPDPRQHTRTTVPNLIERVFVCPNHVNYHCEHHFIPIIPAYNLKAFHELLLERGYYRDHPLTVEIGYRNVIQRALNKTSAI